MLDARETVVPTTGILCKLRWRGTWALDGEVSLIQSGGAHRRTDAWMFGDVAV